MGCENFYLVYILVELMLKPVFILKSLYNGREWGERKLEISKLIEG